QKVASCAVASAAKENDLPLIQPVALKKNLELFEQFKRLEPDVIVVVAYGKYLPNEILSMPKYGCINVHPSLLPKYRGAAPINWAIINGEKNTGVTTMYLNDGMDSGDTLLQVATEIMPHETAEELHNHLAVTGAELLIKTLDEVAKGLKGVPQKHEEATFAPLLKKEDGLIDWSMSAEAIYNRIRGLQSWPKAYTMDEGKLLSIFDAAVIEKDAGEQPGTIIDLKGGIIVATGSGQLCLLEVQLPGKRRMPAVDFVKGGKLKVGDRFL
ncbi:MAG: methionyl-tRNA formyltransferase, partial [Pseudomonadota bacterium]